MTGYPISCQLLTVGSVVMSKISPLYNLIASFSNEKLSAYAIKKKEALGRSYFLVDLDITDIQGLLTPPYVLKDAHFSIDEEYSNDFGYTPIHYTQRYSAPGQKDVIIHGYLDLEGSYKYCQTSGKKLTNEQEEELKKQIIQALPQLNPIFTEQTQLQNTLKRKADALDIELTNLSRNVKPKTARKNYIKKAYEFIETIEELNHYSLKQDKRDGIISKNIRRMEAISDCEQPALESKQAYHAPSSPGETPQEPALSPKETLKKLYTDSIADFNTLVQSFYAARSTPEQAISVIKQIYDQLFILYQFPDKLITKENTKKIEKALKKITKFESEQSHLFMETALSGDIQNFIQQYETCSQYINQEFYEQLLNLIIEEKNPQKEATLLEIANYLNENDSKYRKFIYKASQENHYPISKEETVNINCANFQLKYKTLKASLLCKLYLKNKVNAFSIFLSHSASYEHWGLILQQDKIAIHPLFYTIASIPKNDTIKFLTELLKYPLDPNRVYTKEEETQLNKARAQNLAGFRKTGIKGSLQHADPNFHTSVLALLSKIPDIGDLLEQIILPQTSLGELATHFASFSNDISLKQLLFSSQKYIIDYKGNTTLAHKKAEQQWNPSGPYLSSIIYPVNIENSDLFYFTSITEKNIDEKIKGLSLEDFNKEYKALFAQAETEIRKFKELALSTHRNQYLTTARNQFLGCEALLMKYANEHISDDQKRYNFIKNKSTALYENIIYSLRNDPSKNCQVKVPLYENTRDNFAIEGNRPAPIVLSKTSPKTKHQDLKDDKDDKNDTPTKKKRVGSRSRG